MGPAAAAEPPAGFPSVEAYRAYVETRHDERVAELVGETGFLNLVGLYWLAPGENSFGTATDNDLVFPVGEPVMGRFQLADGVVTMGVARGVDVRVGEQRVRTTVMQGDHDGPPTVATHGDLAWQVIERGGRVGVRLRNYAHPALAAFAGIPRYPVDPAWRVPAVLDTYDKPRPVRYPTVIEGLEWDPVSPGLLRFQLGEATYTLEPVLSGGRLFVVFADRTSGHGTYGGGRFLYADPPDDHGATTLDFNLAHNPPCVFNTFATCPLAPPKNRLPLPIAAGEKWGQNKNTVSN